MSPKAKAISKNDKGAAKAAKPAKGGKAEKAEKKTAKAAKGAENELPTNADGTPVDPDELEEQEDAAAAAGQSSSDAAAAAAGSTEQSASFKNFRHHPDMENFYRFIFENDLRHEALAIIDEIMIEKRNRKQAKSLSKH